MGTSRKFLGTLKCLFLCTLLVCNVVVGSSNVKAMDFSIYGSDLLFNPIEFIESLFEENKSIVGICLLNGKKAALELNDLKDNKSEFRKSLRNVLDEYYSTSKAEREELEEFTENIQWNLLNVDVPRAWNRFDKSDIDYIRGIIIAVIDCGVQMNHKDLKEILMRNKSVDVTQNNKKLVNCKDEASATGQYTSAHGTSVAGVLAAEGNNGYGGAGISSIGSSDYCNSFEIMAIKCDESYDSDRHITVGSLAKAINYAVDNGAEVINISYSANKSKFGNKFSAVETAIKKAIAAKVTVVCAAGNESSTTVRYPAGFSGVIGVGATWKNGKLANYSNESSAVDIVAPGGYLEGAKMYVASPTTLNPSGYKYGEGTSYATPHVAGTVAMMLSIHYGLSPSQILSRLQSRSTTTVSGRINKNKKFKVLNAGKSVALMEPGDES